MQHSHATSKGCITKCQSALQRYAAPTGLRLHCMLVPLTIHDYSTMYPMLTPYTTRLSLVPGGGTIYRYTLIKIALWASHVRHPAGDRRQGRVDRGGTVDPGT